MKSRIIFFLIFMVISFCGYAQKAKPKVVYETIIVYDTITVYDTVFVYDTIKTENKVLSENNFKNNFTAEKAYLAIDTSNFSAAVLLINKKDTATLSINSIILSETNKNLDTMKKSLLTLLVSAALTQAANAQESKMVQPLLEEEIPNYTIGAGVIMATTSNSGNLQGINVNMNKVRNKKLLFGLSSDIGRVYQKGFASGTHEGAAVHGNISGVYTNVFVNTSYYFWGNASKNKAGLYGKLGLGTVWYRTHKNISTVGWQVSENYQKTSANFSAELCMGGSLKLGNGKLFVEIVSLTSLVEKNSLSATQSEGGTDPSYPFTRVENTTILNNNFSGQHGLRLGYAINF